MNPTEEKEPREEAGLEAGVSALIERAALAYLRSVGAGDLSPAIELQVPRKPEHGDWATNIALKLAKPLKTKPIEIAEAIRERIETGDLIEPPEVAPPGFINLRMSAAGAARTLRRILSQGESYGSSGVYAGQRALVEFVSANPTGPLHIGHGRNAVVGDTLSRIYAMAGYDVEREYYFNDAGVQMRLLGESLRARYLQRCGREASIPENGYQGDYLKDIAASMFDEAKDTLAEADVASFTERASASIMITIREDLVRLGIDFDHWFSESTLHEAGRVDAILETLRKREQVYEKDGALWLKTTAFGDDKDRVVRKSDGSPTYLAPDIAYHQDKFDRGFDRVVNILGADHHGYVVRLKAAVEALGLDSERLHCVLIQMVGVKQDGEARKLSTRAGDFVPLAEILDELGADVVRFYFLMRAADSQLVFDIDLARQRSMDNPYYYIQYAHARCCSLMRKAEETGAAWEGGEDAKLELLSAPEERAIIFQLARLPRTVAEAAEKDEPLPLVTYLRELAASFHGYYTAGNKNTDLRCIRPDAPELTQARLTLIAALRSVLANAMRLMGLTPMERL